MKMIDTTINIKAKSGVCIKIPVNNKVTILTGDSATGKTKMIKYMKELSKDTNEIEHTTVNIDSFVFCDDIQDMINNINANIKHKVIIIDRFDTMSNNKKIIEFMINSENYFIVSAHKEFTKCGYSTDSMLGIRHDGINYEAYKLFPTPSDFFRQNHELV